ncbi:stress response protein YsnF [Psychrobacter sp. PL15]|uniref:YsnF/AvaK domain-containing protein n=1 Tax=Psychrobacter sp. PL15 TaxID=3071719 RepID=UPI002E01E167|nr:stress response protein YsnF [Psychrobacter sp. PL15]
MSTDHNNNDVNQTTASLSPTDVDNVNTVKHDDPSINQNADSLTESPNLIESPNLTENAAVSTISKQSANYLELLEERPVVNKERLDVGKVTVTKHSRTKMIEVPIELVEEYITIRTEYNDAESQDLLSGNYDDQDILRHVEPSLDSKAVVTINGKQVEIGDTPVEIVLSRQVATITKNTYAIQEVEISKTTHTHTDNITVELKHEELDITEEGFLQHEGTRTHNK